MRTDRRPNRAIATDYSASRGEDVRLKVPAGETLAVMRCDRGHRLRAHLDRMPGWRIRLLTLTGCAIVAAASLIGAIPAVAAITAPGFFSGPEVVSEGLLWSGRQGVSLSSSTGTMLLARDRPLDAVLVHGGWTVVAEPLTFRVGRTGGHLQTIPALQFGCFPIQATPGEAWLDALTEGQLYTVLPAGCLGLQPEQAQMLVSVRLRTLRLRVIRRVRRGPVSLVAAGHRLALTYLSRRTQNTPRGLLRVEVLDSRTGKLLYSLTPPPDELSPTEIVERARYRSGAGTGGSAPRLPVLMIQLFAKTQIDSEGDVLVTRSARTRSSEGLSRGTASGWWGNARIRVGRPLGEPADGALADGRIAYVSNQGAEEQIDLLNLRTGETRTEVAFPGLSGRGGARPQYGSASVGSAELWVHGACLVQNLLLRRSRPTRKYRTH